MAHNAKKVCRELRRVGNGDFILTKAKYKLIWYKNVQKIFLSVCTLSSLFYDFHSFRHISKTMTSVWRYFCCICDSADDKRSHSARYEFSTKLRNNRRNKYSKNTWARRSLLDHDQIELNDIPSEQYQMKAKEDSFQGRLQDNFTPKKRPPVQGMFENSFNESSASKTTFPWMDERFVPSSRNGTRLGISSVQLNAKRNETAEKNNASKNVNKEIVKTNIFAPYKSQSFTDGQERQHNRNLAPDSSNLNKNFQNIQNGHVLRNNFNTAPVEAKNNRRPVRLGIPNNNRDKPMVFRAPSSDVGVRQVSLNNSQIRQDKVPKLEDYNGKGSSSYVHSRPTIMDIFPSNNVIDSDDRETEADLSYASEIIFRKQPSEHSGSEVSLKRSGGPGIFSMNSNKYERLKPERSKSENTKAENPKSKGKYSNLSSESMYGYVPKAVQNVRASNALEGTKIDDFFMQRMHERQLEDFGSIDKAKENNEEETVIITSVVDSTENLSATSETSKISQVENKTILEAKIVSRDKDISEITKDTNPSTKNSREVEGENRKTDKTSVISGNTESETSKNAKLSATSGNIEHTFNEAYKTATSEGNAENKTSAMHNDAITGSNKEHKANTIQKIAAAKCGTDDKVNENDKYEDQVIMIDFPPNSETDKMTSIPVKKSGSNVSKRSSASSTSKIANGEVLY